MIGTSISGVSPLASIIVLIATFFAVVLLDVFGERRYIRSISVIGVVLAILGLWVLPALPGGQLLHADLFTFFFTVLFLLVTLCILLATHESRAVFEGSVLLATVGMIFASATNDLILLYLGIELVTAPTYVLVAYGKTPRRMEAAVKYFVVGLVSSALLLFGLALLAATSGTTTISLLGDGLLDATDNPLVLLGVGAVIAGLGFKLGLFPFYFWIPDVYEGASSEVTGFLAAASKKAAYAALLRIALVLVALHNVSMLFSILAALTMIIPGLIALWQNNVKRLLAYSIMSQAGFLVMGIAAGSAIGFGATLFHSFTHAFMSLGAFLIVGVFASNHLQTIDDIKGIGWKNPILALPLTFFLCSLAGIPLLSGFASKFSLLYAALDAGLFWLAVTAVIMSVVSLYYYFKIIRAMYAYGEKKATLTFRPGVKVVIIICLALTILIGIYPWPFIKAALSAAASLF